MRALARVLATGFVSVWMIGCEDGPQASFTRSFTSTVAVGNHRTLSIETWVPLDITGDPTGSDAIFTIEATVSASTATAARAIAGRLALTVEPSGDVLSVALRAPSTGTLSGTMRVRFPSRLGLIARVPEGTLAAHHLDGPADLAAAQGLLVEGATHDVTAVAGQGDIIVDAELPPGRNLSAQNESGTIDLRLPRSVSARLEADVLQQGEIIIEHPMLPRALGISRTRYRAELNGGLSAVRALTQMGTIVIRAR